MTLPKHDNPITDNAAHAPYNFIPLPDIVVKAVEKADELPDHDDYVDGRYTGYFEVTLSTQTPLYIRGGLSTKPQNKKTPSEFEQAEIEKSGNAPKNFRKAMKNRPEFFATNNLDQPVIPGSSLRGMLRNLIEIITYSKVKWVTDKKLFFRTMDDSVVGESYRKRMMENVEGGFLIRNGESYTIHVSKVVRVHHSKLGGADQLFDGYPPNQKPKWRGISHQHVPVWVTLTSSGNFVDKISLTEETGSDWHEGRLVITGNMPGRRDGSGGKKKEFVFLLPQKGSEEIEIPETMLERFHDDDQMTQWQQNAFPKDEPRKNGRLRNGLLLTRPATNEEPVFFLRENKKIAFFGRARMFRLPYQQRPLDLMPLDLRSPDEIDYAEAMFGFVRTQDELNQMTSKPKQGSKGRAYAGRIFITDGYYQPNQGKPWMQDAPDGIIEPHILASPKPTSFQHYLTQDTPNNRKTLYHYDSNVDTGEQVTTLRGFKLYWTQGKKTARDLQATPKDERDKKRAFEKGSDGNLRPKWSSTQHTRMKPVDSGKKFAFQVHFENLTDVELGALQWALSVPDCHRLGMGKPLGMGVIQLEKPILYLNGRLDRYKILLSNDNAWNVGKPEGKQDFILDFESAIEGELQKQLSVQVNSFQQIDRIKMLLTMLTWQEHDSQYDDKQYMSNLNAFRKRPVLPDPLNLGGVKASGRSRKSKRTGQYTQQQSRGRPSTPPRQSTPPPPKQRPRRPKEDDIPEVRENVSDFAKLFMKKVEQQEDNEKDE